MNDTIMTLAVKKRIIYWIPLTAIGFINGTIRVVLFEKLFSDDAARQISSLLLIILIAIYSAIVFRKLEISNYSSAWQTGFVWMILTVVFEFALGFMLNTSINTMLAEYNLLEGKLWPLVLVAILLIPPWYFKVKDKG